ncbi:MAG TPA: 50S ribosomal protein L1 [Thermoflexia bacterium]|nr:50S ribosomal protein L1 [Thermoflexia bacterium]
MTKHGKKYLAMLERVEREREYGLEEAVNLVKEISYANFDATVELHVRTGLDPRHAAQQIRGMVQLPHGLGTTVRVVVFATPDVQASAEEAGADHVITGDEGIQRIMDGWTDFDVTIAIPQMMAKVGRLGRVLGPRGLMPNPKTGTMVPADDLAAAIKASKAGQVEYRLDRSGNLHFPIGKVSFSTEQLLGNMAAIMSTLRRVRPAAINKVTYIRRVTLAPTMGPGIKVEPLVALAME